MYIRFSRLLKNILLYQPNLVKDIVDIVEEWESGLVTEAAECLRANLDSVESLRRDVHEKVYSVRLDDLARHKQELEKHKKVR